MEDKVLIFGKGYFGSRLQQDLGFALTEKKIFNLNDAQTEVERFRPRTIVNCIGFIGRNVDDCELNQDKALCANTFAPLILGEICLRNKIKLVHISSGCIYHYDYAKDSPIDEEKTPDFFELYYSRTKIYAEATLQFLAKKLPVLILRPRVPLDDRPSPKNLLSKLIAAKKIINLPNSVTYIPDFVRVVKHLMEINATGIYHVANEGALYYPDLLKIYKKYRPEFEYEVIDFQKLNLVRTNLVLSVKKLAATGFKVRNINDVLEECVKNYLKS